MTKIGHGHKEREGRKLRNGYSTY